MAVLIIGEESICAEGEVPIQSIYSERPDHVYDPWTSIQPGHSMVIGQSWCLTRDYYKRLIATRQYRPSIGRKLKTPPEVSIKREFKEIGQSCHEIKRSGGYLHISDGVYIHSCKIVI